MVHTAAAYAKQRLRLRTFACTSSIGPGATNMVTGAANATVNRLPVLLLPGDRFATRRVRPVLQQLESVRRRRRLGQRCVPSGVALLRSHRAAGDAHRCAPGGDACADLSGRDRRGHAGAAPGRPGGGLGLAEDLLAPRVWAIPQRPADETLLAQAVERIIAAERPMIVSGGGTLYSDAADALDAFATRFGIPVTETQAGKGALRWDHPFNLGALGSAGGSAGNAIARDADLVIAIGTRLSDFPTMSWSSWQDPDVAFISINVAELDAAKAAALPLHGDARVTLEELHAALNARGWSGASPDRLERIERLRSEWNDEVERVLHLAASEHVSQPEAIRLVNEAAGEDGVVVCAAGGLPGDLAKVWRASGPGRYHMEYGFSTMGYEIAGGMGVAMAEPDRRTYVMVGDGSYLMLAQRDRHGLPGRHLDDHRAAGQPRLPLHPKPRRRLWWRQSLQRLPGS